MPLYEKQFSEEHDFPRVDKPSKTLVIASTSRCGSHMLGHALYETGAFGFPLEYMNPGNLAEWRRRLGIEDFDELMTEIQRRRTSPNGVFGIKVHYKTVRKFGGFNKFLNQFPDACYVLLHREDVLAQAVSYSIARQTGEWIRGQKPRSSDPVYRFRDIERCLRQILIDNASWKYALGANGCRYIEMRYESIRDDLQRGIESVAKFMALNVEYEKVPTSQVTQKQRSKLNDEWRERFVASFDSKQDLLDVYESGVCKRIARSMKWLRIMTKR